MTDDNWSVCMCLDGLSLMPGIRSYPSQLSQHIMTLGGYRQPEDGQSYMRDASERALGRRLGHAASRMSRGPHTSTQRQSATEINHAVIWFRERRCAVVDTGRRLVVLNWSAACLMVRGAIGKSETERTEPITCPQQPATAILYSTRPPPLHNL